MTELQELPLGDIVTMIDYRGKTPTKISSGIPLITAKIVKNGRIYPPTEFISREEYKERMTRGIPKIGDILITTEAPLGEVAELKDANVAIGQRLITMHANENKLHHMYLKYYLQSHEGQAKLSQRESGTTVIGIKQSELRKILIPLPPLTIQKKIAAVLGTLDDKIELNNKINHNLEQQAQALFQSWFIDFEPFGGKMPDDWKIGNLLDVAEYLNGLAMQKFRPTDGEKGIPVLKIKELRQGFCDSNSEFCTSNVKRDYIIHNGDVIFSWSGSLLVDFWCGGECGLNQHLFKVFSKKFDKWFYYAWTTHHLDRFVAIAADKATTMGHIKRDELEKAEVIIPKSEDYFKISKVLAPIYDLIIQNRIENTRLAQLRDALLPKLMSGEIDVDKVDISNNELLFSKGV
jgi:type I restriction enzyme S subunit